MNGSQTAAILGLALIFRFLGAFLVVFGAGKLWGLYAGLLAAGILIVLEAHRGKN